MSNFIKEVGAILSPERKILHWTEGTATLVEFPQDLIWQLHKNSPGIVWGFSHIHPPGMTELSHEDLTTLKAQVMALYPFPVRFITIAEINWNFVETIHLGQLESLEEWINRGKEGSRKFTCDIENQQEIDIRDGNYYANFLWRRAYSS